MTILDRIAEHTRTRVAADKKLIPMDEMRRIALSCKTGNGTAFYEAIARDGLSFICEIKKASPSKGVIDPVFDYRKIVEEYNSAGADCISCLTEPKWFHGSDFIFSDIRTRTELPMIRKDFVIDSYQLYQAKTLGADCVLLICALLDSKTLSEYLDICGNLNIAALVEVHDESEISVAVTAHARMIGINNRDLRDFSVDLNNSARMRERIPSGCLCVAESGVKTPEDASAIKKAGADGVLIGEALMTARDKTTLLSAMRTATK